MGPDSQRQKGWPVSESQTTFACFMQAGIAVGEVHTSLNPATGRMSYWGKVMNRAARIAGQATSSQVSGAEAVHSACRQPRSTSGSGTRPLHVSHIASHRLCLLHQPTLHWPPQPTASS